MVLTCSHARACTTMHSQTRDAVDPVLTQPLSRLLLCLCVQEQRHAPDHSPARGHPSRQHAQPRHRQRHEGRAQRRVGPGEGGSEIKQHYHYSSRARLLGSNERMRTSMYSTMRIRRVCRGSLAVNSPRRIGRALVDVRRRKTGQTMRPQI